MGRIIKFRRLESFIKGNGGVRAVAIQDGGTYAVLAKNGNCTPFFNADFDHMVNVLGDSKFDSIPVMS